MTLLLKDPQARIAHAFAWDDYADGQIVLASEWRVTPVQDGGLSVEDAAFDLTWASATLAGGRVGTLYRVTNQVTLSDGQVDERSIIVRVEER